MPRHCEHCQFGFLNCQCEEKEIPSKRVMKNTPIAFAMGEIDENSLFLAEMAYSGVEKKGAVR
jgi:hypothetical protein